MVFLVYFVKTATAKRIKEDQARALAKDGLAFSLSPSTVSSEYVNYVEDSSESESISIYAGKEV